MEPISEDNRNTYILKSKQGIDSYIYRNDYKKAFLRLILVLERLDNNEKVDFIDYYSKKFNSLFLGVSYLDNRDVNFI